MCGNTFSMSNIASHQLLRKVCIYMCRIWASLGVIWKAPDHPVCMGSLTPVRRGYPTPHWVARAHGVPDPRAHRVGGRLLGSPCARGSLIPCARGSNGCIPLSHPLHYINPPSSSSNPNLFPLLEPPLLEHHISHSSHFPHPNLLILW